MAVRPVQGVRGEGAEEAQVAGRGGRVELEGEALRDLDAEETRVEVAKIWPASGVSVGSGYDPGTDSWHKHVELRTRGRVVRRVEADTWRECVEELTGN